MTSAWQTLLANVAIIAIMTSCWSHVSDRLEEKHRARSRIIGFGLFCGLTGVIIMQMPVTIAAGFHVDMRSVMIILSSFFVGPLGALVTAGIIVTTHVIIGGSDVTHGIIGSVLAVVVGLGLRYAHRGRDAGMRYILVLACLSAAMLAISTLLLPSQIRTTALAGPIVPAICMIFIGVLLAGTTLLYDERRRGVIRLNELYVAVMQALPDSFNAKDLSGMFVVANDATAKLLGAKSSEELIGNTDRSFFSEESAAQYRADEKEVVANGVTKIQDQVLVNLDGSTKWTTTLKSPFTDRHGQIVGVISHDRDITHERLLASELAEARQQLHIALSHMQDGLAIFDPDGRLRFCNQQYLDLFPKAGHVQVRGIHIRDILHSTLAKGEIILPEGAEANLWVEQEIVKTRALQNTYITLASGRVFEKRTAALQNGGWLTTFSDISNVRKIQSALEEQARTDGLTGLLNRRAFDDLLSIEFARSYRQKSTLGLMMVDIDCFKAYNDTYGHPAGDEVLKQVAQSLKAHCRRPPDFAARYGGEELCGIFPGTDDVCLFKIAENFRNAVRDLNIPHSGSQKNIVTISIGIALKSGNDTLERPADLISFCDRALYAAKDAGRDCVELATRNGLGNSCLRRKI